MATLAQTILSNGTITASGSSSVFQGFGNNEISLVINVVGPVTGTTPSLTFTIQEVDPGDQYTALGASKVGPAITAVGSQILTIPNLTSGTMKIVWTVTGSSPSFGGVYVTMVAKDSPLKIIDPASSNQLSIENTGAAAVILKDSSGQSLGTGDNPIAVTTSIGASKTFYSTNFTQLSTPARLSSSTSGPFTVGNTTFTIAVNGVTQNYAFPTRAAQAGYSLSGLDPSTSNANLKSVKVSVDGGTTTQITIAQDLTSGANIAAALQAAIRANVPNGSSVVVDWSTTNTGRYTITSGSTGTSSRVVITKGGDGLASALKIGLAFGGTEFTGLASNSYRNTEVAALLTAGLNDVDAAITTAGLVEIITRAGGSSATLQVTAGGSNTALGYSTSQVTGTTGTGSSQLNVNGSSTNVRFGIDIPNGYSFTCSELLFTIRDANAATMKFFGGLAQLTNGILVEYKTGDSPTGTLLTARTNAELLAQANEGATFAAAFSDNTDLVSARITLVNGITLHPSSSDGIFVTIRDNLTGLDAFTITARGFLEA